ncbi:MAG: glucose-6-phosphate 1-dehydrogenase [Acidobacteriota bacterium]|jgi:glucose-6-phosphate 1-dehydrogenase|nr:glucose-6-phosphate 1-dehydrogenase [Acidobacteriota bacterium]
MTSPVAIETLEPTEEWESRPAPPCAMVIFGATGDLTKRKLLPALYNLVADGLLPDAFAVVGVGRSPLSEDEFRARMEEDLRHFATMDVDDAKIEWLLQRLRYVAGDLSETETFHRLAEALSKVDEELGTGGNYLYYLAVPPSLFSEYIHRLGEAGLTREEEGRWRRVIIEKPFGHDLDSARRLNQEIREVLGEKQIYRIDHYLGKETVQNIMAFRFANGIFEPIWNRRYVDHVQITVAETVGIEGRGGYYEEAGALRDMVQNHMFQLLALTAMEPPVSFAADTVRDERVKVLSAIRPFSPEDVLRHTVRGQYGEGMIEGEHGGERGPAYRAEKSVAPGSATETFVALELKVDNWRWADVPFYLRTGKRLPKRVTEIAVQFKRAPLMLFRDTPVERLNPNLLVMKIQPDEGISLRFEGKVPGPVMRLGTVRMHFQYVDYFGAQPHTGYETLLYDCMLGDSTLFHRSDMVEAGWCVVQPILDVWKALPPRNFPNYAAGTWGPKEAEELIQRDGRKWRE